MKDGPRAVAAVPAPADALAVYRRLLRYAWPHRGQFLIGVLGMVMFAAHGCRRSRWFIKISFATRLREAGSARDVGGAAGRCWSCS